LGNNPWTLRLGDQLRFGLVTDSAGIYIRDRRDPSRLKWGYAGLQAPIGTVSESYGMISRVLDPTTGHLVVAVAGVLWGTRAAGECLVDPGCIGQAEKLAPGDWKHKNIQIVVSARAVLEDSGPPRVVAAYVW
jgi:hypothetical protein